MAERTRDVDEVERALAAVGAVEQVMRAVWALARAQLPHVEAAAHAAHAWSDQAETVVRRIAGAPHLPEPGEVLWIVIGPERPFCGPLARMQLDQLPAEGVVGLVGARLAEVAAQDPVVQQRVRFRLAAAVTADELSERAEAVAAEVLATSDGADAWLLHSADGGVEMRSSPLLSRRDPATRRPPEAFSPLEVVLAAALQEAVEGQLVVGLAEALRAEVRARLAAADGARRACERELSELGQLWRVLRQEAITQELLELNAARSG